MSNSYNINKIYNDMYKNSSDAYAAGMKQLSNQKIKIFSILIFILLFFSVLYYIYDKLTLDKRNCRILTKVYNSVPRLNSITTNGSFNNFLLRDFYIKTAYNCCSPGNFRNDFVNLCALRTCIGQGARCLDFEIYSMNNRPVIATSSVLDFTVKETYNYLSLANAFDTILREAFSSGTCPNFNDPLILHFRIMSNNCEMYNNFANLFINNKQLNARTLGKKYSYEFNDPEFGSQNLGTVPIKNLKEKIIIAIDTSNPLYQHTKLDEYVNITSSSAFLRLLRFRDVMFTQDLTLTDFNKKNMSIVLPDVQTNNANPNFNVAREYGCQFIGMSFQNYDINLQHYNDFFDGNRSAFVLKPKHLRFIPLTIPVPPPQKPEFSYETRKLQSDYYDYRI